jgi:16S rRNA (cytidine1402-2'-O)-methyltransferase
MATLFLVSTPIGNLGDLSPRAGETLAGVARILAEDTRRTRKLLSHLGISTPLVSLHAHNEAARGSEALDWLDRGEDLALVSDAGTPLVSDPGERLVVAALDRGHRVVPIPGPSAVLAALAASGLPGLPFTFFGYPPRKGKERARFLGRVADSPDTAVLFESPERLVGLLRDLVDADQPGRRGVVARELTKLHEEFVRGTLEELLLHFQHSPPRGEITVVLEGVGEPEGSGEIDRAAAYALARALLEEGSTPSHAARELARRLPVSRNDAYRIVQDLSGDGTEGK